MDKGEWSNVACESEGWMMPHGYIAGLAYRYAKMIEGLEVDRLYTITYDDGTELRGRYIDQERGFIRFMLADGSKLVCRTGSVRLKPNPTPSLTT